MQADALIHKTVSLTAAAEDISSQYLSTFKGPLQMKQITVQPEAWMLPYTKIIHTPCQCPNLSMLLIHFTAESKLSPN